jgi:AcrR family transcriptional regulator
MSVSTRDRILDSAMELFGQHGFKGTSVAAIETAAGLAPGGGGLYRHFPSKQALLQAGIARHLDRLDALRDLRSVFTGVGDLRIELSLLARYALVELDRDADLLRIVLSEARSHPELVDTAINQLIAASYTGFASWLRQRTSIDAERARMIAALALGALFSTRLLHLFLNRDLVEIPDETFVAGWVQMVHSQITPPARPPSRPRGLSR